MDATDKICLGMIVLVALAGFFFSSDFGVGQLNQWIPGIGDGYIYYTDVNEPFFDDTEHCINYKRNSCVGTTGDCCKSCPSTDVYYEGGKCYLGPSHSLPKCWWCKSVRVIKFCEYDKWHFRIDLVQGSKPPYDLCMGSGSFSGKELDFTISTSIESPCSATASVTSTTVKSFENSHFRTEVEGGGSIYLGDKFLFSPSQKGLFEIVPSYLEPDMVDILFQGLSKGRVNISGASDGKISVKVGSRAGVRLRNTRFLPIISCQKKEGEILGIETFAGGRTLSFFDLRYSGRFCLAHPVIVTLPEGSLSTAEIYMKLVRGEVLQVPSDETWTLFYYFSVAEAGLPLDFRCEKPGEVFSVEKGECHDISGVAHICSEGEFLPDLLICGVYPEIRDICTRGVLVNGECKYFPPTSIICPIGFEYSIEDDVCFSEPTTEYRCIEGTYSPISGKCEIFPIKVICPPLSSYDSKKGKCVDLERNEYSPLKSKREACEIINGVWKDTVCIISPKVQILCPEGYMHEMVDNEDICVKRPLTKETFIEWLEKNKNFIFFLTIALISFICVAWYLMREE